MLHDVLSE